MTTTERHPIPAIVCASWCEDGDGHTDAVFRGDQTCWGQATYVELSLEDISRDETLVYTQRIGAMAYRSWREASCVYVHLDGIELPAGRGTLDDSLHLTADEARQLAAGLLRAADQTEEGTG